jgi:hypothetical protein
MIKEFGEYFSSRVMRAHDMVARATPGPMLVRLMVWVLGVLALMLAYPAEAIFDFRASLAMVLVAVLPAVFPRTRMVSFVLFAAAFGWLVNTAGFGQPITAVRVVALAGTLYLLHNGAALAAVLPYDTVLAPGVLIGWFARALAVVAVTVVLGAVAVAGAGVFGGRTFLVAALVGIATVCLLGWLFVSLVRRGES